MNKGSYAASCNFNYRNPGLSSGSRVILIGTAHVSEKSVAEVNDVIDREKPDIVAVELCKGRYKALKGEDEVKEINIKEMLSGGKFYYFLLHWLLAYVQKKIGSDTGVKPGAEMLSAIDKAEKAGLALRSSTGISRSRSDVSGIRCPFWRSSGCSVLLLLQHLVLAQKT